MLERREALLREREEKLERRETLRSSTFYSRMSSLFEVEGRRATELQEIEIEFDRPMRRTEGRSMLGGEAGKRRTTAVE